MGNSDPPHIDVNWGEIPNEVHTKVRTLTLLVSTTICALVEDEGSVRVKVQANYRRVMFTVRVSNADVGLAVGAQGSHANALRTLLIAASRKLRFHFELDIGGPEGDPDWSSD